MSSLKPHSFGAALRGLIRPMPIDHIRDDFEVLDDWEDRYRYVMELGRAMPPLDEAVRTEANKVRGCASQVWLASRVVPTAAYPNPRLAVPCSARDFDNRHCAVPPNDNAVLEMRKICGAI